jgi:hypothetical protein
VRLLHPPGAIELVAFGRFFGVAWRGRYSNGRRFLFEKQKASQREYHAWSLWMRGMARCPYCVGLEPGDFQAVCDCWRFDEEFPPSEIEKLREAA